MEKLRTPEYLDRFNVESGWDNILFNSVSLQASELNELQSIYDFKLRKFGDIFISDGSVISGCEITPPKSYSGIDPAVVTIGKGSLYIGGKIITTPGVTVSGIFTGEDFEWIYVDVEEQTLEDQSDLGSPEIQEPNFVILGANRRILNLKFYNEATKTPHAIKFDLLRNGQMLFKRSSLGLDKIAKMIESRIYEENGDFLVSGANIVTKNSSIMSTLCDVMISPYVVYIKGRRFEKASTQIVGTPKILDSFLQQDIAQVLYSTGSVDFLTNNVFALEVNYIKNLKTCIYPVRVIKHITHLVAGGNDYLEIDGSLAKILTVTYGATTYTDNIDFKADVINLGIDWSLPGVEPSTGSIYTVELVYYREIDFEVKSIDSSFIPEDYAYRRYPNASLNDYSLSEIVITDTDYYGLLPSLVVNTEYYVYKRRIDAVVISEFDGTVKIVNGNYYEFPPARRPKISNNDFFLYWLTLVPGSLPDQVASYKEDNRIFRVTQRGISSMESQLSAMQENLVLVQLDTDALTTPVTGIMKGIYTNLFNSMDNSDIGYDGSNPLFPNSYDVGYDDGTLTTSIVINGSSQNAYKDTCSLYSGNKSFTLQFFETVAISQLKSTSFVSVQPFAYVYNMQTLSINPMSDFWYDHNEMTVVEQGPASVVQKKMLVTEISGSGRTSTPVADTIIPLGVSTSLTVIPFARQRTIGIQGNLWFIPGGNQNVVLRCSVNGVDVSGFSTNVILNSDGTFNGLFTIPAGIECGIVPVRVYTDPEYIEATVNYTSSGEVQTNTRTNIRIPVVEEVVQEVFRPIIQTQKTIETQVTWVDAPASKNNFAIKASIVDPIAQTIFIDDEMFISSIEVYFRQKSPTSGVRCKVEEVVNGYPSENVIGNTFLESSMVKTSLDGSVSTKFTFKDPIYLEKGKYYAFTIKSDSPDYLVYVCNQGQKSYEDGEMIVSPVYVGVFFESSNDSTWSAVQERKIKFKIYKAQFSNSGVMETNTQMISDSWFQGMFNISEYPGTFCELFYSADNGIWTKFKLGDKVNIADKSLATTCKLRFQMSSSNPNLSPTLSNEFGTLYWKYKTQGYWYSPWLDMGDENTFDNVKMRMYAIPSDISFKVNLIASVDNITWFKYSSDDHQPKITEIDMNLGIHMYEYSYNISDNFNGQNLARYLKLNIEITDSNYSGSDTPRIYDFRAVTFESI
jgi:hypothetical protein